MNINVRIPMTLKTAIGKYIDQDVHINLSEFVRDALREKIKKEMPWLYEELLRPPKGRVPEREAEL